MPSTPEPSETPETDTPETATPETPEPAASAPPSVDLSPSGFIFVSCQRGSESLVKDELAKTQSNLNLSYSRPGFVTFKCTEDASGDGGQRGHGIPLKFSLVSTFARTAGWSLGKITGDEAGPMIEAIAQTPVANVCKHLHVWQRDSSLPGQRNFEPGPTALSDEVAAQIATHPVFSGRKLFINRDTLADDLVLDVCMVQPNEWWYGFHYATTVAGRWPGGVPTLPETEEVISRAWYKLAEALQWSGITVQPGDVCAEVGSAPGGACQYMLERGARVIGIDPAEMDPEILAHEKFTHLRGKGNETKKRDLKDVKWLMADLNATPTYTLDTVSEFVTHESTRIRGLVLTLKMTDEKLAAQIPEVRKRVKELGFSVVKTRQLAFNRGEFCLVAAKDKFALRSSRRKPKVRKPRTRKKFDKAKGHRVDPRDTPPTPLDGNPTP